MYDISVIVPTYNRAAFLEPCLISLCQQNLDPARFEICVVANACTDATPAVVAKVAAQYPLHRLFMVEEAVAGLSRARNCGLRNTTAPLIANMDDDGTVYPNWLELFLARYAEFGDDLAIVGGEIEPVWGAPKPDWLTPVMMSHLSARSGQGDAPHFVGEDGYCLEGNSCYRRVFLENAGLFPENLGRVGSCLLSGEGILESHIRQQGGKLFFDPAIILKHYIHADRLRPLWLRHRYFWQGISRYVGMEYKRKKGVAVDNQILLNLPLQPEDWVFVNKDTPDNLPLSLDQFQALGFALVLSGIIPVESAS